MGSGEEVRTSVLSELDTLVSALSEKSAEMANDAYVDEVGVRDAAFSTVLPVLKFLRSVMHLLVPGVDERAAGQVRHVLSTTPVGMRDERPLSEEDRAVLQARAAGLVRDVLLMGKASSGVNPESWSSMLSTICVLALVDSDDDALDNLDEVAREF